MKKLTLNLFLIHIFNMLQKIIHPPLIQEITLVKKTGLFDHVNQEQFNEIIQSIRLVKYPKNTVILNEGDLAYELYIIVNGSVRVYTYDVRGLPIALARLARGDYFGEQALLGEGSKTRNANIETIEDTTLIRIPAEKIMPFLKEENSLKLKLRKKGYEQALHILSSSTNFFADINHIIEKIEKKKIIEVNTNEVIFNFGDKPEYVYFILYGEVKIILSLKDKTESVTLHKGHAFGELGFFENKPRTATALATKHSRLLAIDGSAFMEKYLESTGLTHAISALKSIYRLPMKGVVEQYIGSTPELGPMITSIYKMENGKNIVAACAMHQDFFTMSSDSSETGKEYKFEKNPQQFRKLYLANQHLIHIETCGAWDDLPKVCQMMLNDEIVSDDLLKNFHTTGELIWTIPQAETEIICRCMSVEKKQLQALINSGINDLDTIVSETGAASICGSCLYKILEMLGENPWVSAIMKKDIRHNNYIQSYLVKPNQELKPFLPGQYLTILIKINSNWIERVYTISNVYEENAPYRVTVKREPNGLFSGWLFDHAPDQFTVNVGQPTGNFQLDTNEDVPALCFAGGVGITPFIAFAKHLAITNSKKKLHLLYCTLTANDFIFTDEFTEITKNNPFITVSYRSDEKGLLTAKEIINLAQVHQSAEIYICGPEGFCNLILETLKNIQYDSNKIHIEKFLHAGKKPST